MENAGLSVDSGPPDQLDLRFPFDPQADVEHDDLDAKSYDFGLDRPHEDPEQALAGEDPEDAYEGMEQFSAEETSDDVDAEPELDVTASEAHQATANGEAMQNTDTDLGDSDARDHVEYQDEIGYEDDDHIDTGVDADENSTEAGGADGGLPSVPSEEHLEAGAQADDSRFEASIQENDDASSDRGGMDLEPPNEITNPQGSPGGYDEAEPSEHEQGSDRDPVDGVTPEQRNAEHYDGNLEEELESLAHTISEIPDIEVIYNQECYSLFGTSDDDPDSYFLSDVKDLDRPLSQFLSALRAVVSEEIAPSDELLIRFEPLDLEFGERSNAKFLSRSFREILDCHSTLRRVPGVSAEPVIILTVRRDSEEHFLEILADAERVKNGPPDADDSELSENADERSQTSALDVHDEASERAEPGDYQGRDAAANHHPQESGRLDPEEALDHEDVVEEHDEYEHVTQRSTSGRDSVVEEHMEDPHSGEIHDAAEDVGDVPGEEDLDAEEHAEEVPSEENLDTTEHFEDAPEETTPDAENNVEEAPGEETLDPLEPLRDAADEVTSNTAECNEDATGGEAFGSNENLEVTGDEEVPDAEEHIENVAGESHSEDIGESGSWNEQAGGGFGVPQHPLDETDEHDYHMAEQHDDDSAEVSAEVAGSGAGEADAVEDGEPEHGAESNDNDLILAFDDEPDLSTINGDVGEDVDEDGEYAITYDAVETAPDEVEGVRELATAAPSGEAAGENLGIGAPAEAAVETASVHTSTTMNGDEEIDYNAEETADDAFAPMDDERQQSVAPGTDHDEIDWENDEDEDVDRPASQYASVDHEEPKETISASPGGSGKRSRTDEEESLADKTDYKRRRT
ncbi:hypothetical protein VTH06DRAFT_3471 [Thermothelomyces fergusii]